MPRQPVGLADLRLRQLIASNYRCWTLSGSFSTDSAYSAGAWHRLESMVIQRYADNVPPTAIIEVQGGDPSAVMSKAILAITFSEPVRRSSVAFSITPAVDGTLIWEGDGRKAMFRHADLQVGQTYTLSILSAQDVGGNWLAAPVNLEFTVAPTVYSFLPRVAR